MKFTLSWLKDHLDTKASVDEIATTLSAIGLEVESVEDPAKALGAFTIARIVEAKKHPNADKLQVVQVEVAKGRAADGSRLRRTERARRHGFSIRAARHLHSRLEDHAREEAGARRRVERHDVLGGRARAFGRQRGHFRSAGRMGCAASANATSTSPASTIPSSK